MTHTARAKFKVGQRVQQSARWRNGSGFYKTQKPEAERGTVSGFSDEFDCVRVLRDGQKHPSIWHMDFWEPETIN